MRKAKGKMEMADRYSKPNIKFNGFEVVKYIAYAVFLMFIIGGIGVGVFFKVTEIEVTGLSQYSREDIINISGISAGDSLFLINESKIARDITNKMPLIKNVQIIRSIPSKIIIAVTENKALAYIKNGDAYFTMDSTGKIIDRLTAAPEGMINILGATAMSPKEGDKVSFGDAGTTALSYLLEILQTAEEEDIASLISEINLQDTGNITFRYMSRFNVNFGTCDDCAEKIRLVAKAANELGQTETGTITVLSKTEARFVPEQVQ